MALLAIALASAGCGKGGSPAPTPTRTASPPPDPSLQRPAARIAGHWQWSLVSEEDSVRRVEHERWHLEAHGDELRGEYVREVTLLSVEGTPFTCNQDLHYTITTEYRLAGTVRGEALELREVDYDVIPSPCDRGYRKLATYRGELAGDQLILRWDQGAQTLARAAEPPAVEDATPHGPRGAWQWTTRSRNQRDGTSRVERETWTLRESEGGRLGGGYERQVTVFADDGTPFACSGEPSYTYRDHYTVRGTRVGSRISIVETGVEAEDHPCNVPRRDRHLDHATGEILGTYLVLDWRGRRRQVLRRPAAPRDEAVADQR